MSIRNAMNLGLRVFNNTLETTLKQQVKPGMAVANLDQKPLPELSLLTKYLPGNAEADRLRGLLRRSAHTPMSSDMGLPGKVARFLYSHSRGFVQQPAQAAIPGYQNHTYTFSPPTPMLSQAAVAQMSGQMPAWTSGSRPSNQPSTTETLGRASNQPSSVTSFSQSYPSLSTSNGSPLPFTTPVTTPGTLTAGRLSEQMSTATTLGLPADQRYSPINGLQAHQVLTTINVSKPVPVLQTAAPTATTSSTTLTKPATQEVRPDPTRRPSGPKTPDQQLRNVRNTSLALREAGRFREAHEVVIQTISEKSLAGYSNEQAAQMLDELAKSSKSLDKTWLKGICDIISKALSGKMRPEDARVLLDAQLEPHTSARLDKELGELLATRLLDRRLLAPEPDPAPAKSDPAELPVGSSSSKLEMEPDAPPPQSSSTSSITPKSILRIAASSATAPPAQARVGQETPGTEQKSGPVAAANAGKSVRQEDINEYNEQRATFKDELGASLDRKEIAGMLGEFSATATAAHNFAIARLCDTISPAFDGRALPEVVRAALAQLTASGSLAGLVPKDQELANYLTQDLLRKHFALPQQSPSAKQASASVQARPVVLPGNMSAAPAPAPAQQQNYAEVLATSRKLLDARNPQAAYAKMTAGMLGGCLDGCSQSQVIQYMLELSTASDRARKGTVGEIAEILTDLFAEAIDKPAARDELDRLLARSRARPSLDENDHRAAEYIAITQFNRSFPAAG